MRRALTGWLALAVLLVLLGVGALLGARRSGALALPVATIQEWRQYAAAVERGTRTPSGATTRMLTETAIAQHAYAREALDLLSLLGGGVAILGALLAIDLARFRARHAGETTRPPG
jgi:hypothetical protein